MTADAQRRKTLEPPVPITVVLDAALQALGQDRRFRSVSNGRIEIAWLQPRKTKGDEAPNRYKLTIECGFDPSKGGGV